MVTVFGPPSCMYCAMVGPPETCNVDDLYQANCMYEQKHVASIVLVLVLVGTVDGCGYNGQQKDAICDVCGLYQTF